MGILFNDNSLSIGRTPLVKMKRITDGAPRHGAGEGGRTQPRRIPSSAASGHQ